MALINCSWPVRTAANTRHKTMRRLRRLGLLKRVADCYLTIQQEQASNAVVRRLKIVFLNGMTIRCTVEEFDAMDDAMLHLLSSGSPEQPSRGKKSTSMPPPSAGGR